MSIFYDEDKTETLSFIDRHAGGDVRKLALSAAGRDDIDLTFALNQIAGRQKARTKLPSWAERDGIIYPPHLNMEQCSSEKTARYKSSVAARVCAGERAMMVDMTGGMGVDFSFMAPLFRHAVYMERQQMLCDMASHNFKVLGIDGTVSVRCADGTSFVRGVEHATMLFIDPARRDGNGGRTFALSDCEPDVIPMLHDMIAHADVVMMKLSPMLDWHKAVCDLAPLIREIHIVAAGGECKELLAVADSKGDGRVRLFCADDDYCVDFGTDYQGIDQRVFAGDMSLLEGRYLFEPGAAVMKSGCFGALCQRYGVEALDKNSHLFVSKDAINDFPGRCFRIKVVTTMNKKMLANAMKSIPDGSVAVRNFPMTAVQLTKRLKLKNGSSHYIFGTTAQDTHLIIICEKTKSAKNTKNEQCYERYEQTAL